MPCNGTGSEQARRNGAAIGWHWNASTTNRSFILIQGAKGVGCDWTATDHAFCTGNNAKRGRGVGLYTQWRSGHDGPRLI